MIIINKIINTTDMVRLIEETVDGEFYVPMDMREFTAYLRLGVPEYDMFAEAVDTLVSKGILSKTKKGKLVRSSDMGYLSGVYRSTTRGFGFLSQEDGDVFIASDNSGSAMNGDTVQVRLINDKGEVGNHRNGEVIRVLERAVSEVVGSVRVIRQSAPNVRVGKKGRKKKLPGGRTTTRFLVKPDDPRYNFKIEVPASQANGASDGDKVLVKITSYSSGVSNHNKFHAGSHVVSGRILKIFGAAESKDANYYAILHECGIKLRFDEETLKEAREIKRGCSLDGRLDLRDKVIFTIDGADAKDFDDAISLEREKDGYLLGVHIADVAEYVRPGSALDSEAKKRGTSVYFTDKVVPMLPEELSNDVCSLNLNGEKYALSALIHLDKDGNRLSVDFCETVISSKMRGVYHEINDALEKGEMSEYYEKYKSILENPLELMTTLYEKLLAKSRKRGALELETAEPIIILGEDGRPTDVTLRERGLTERIIEQFMLAANEAAANWLSSMELPCVFRIHEEPSEEKVKTFAEFVNNIGLNASPLRRRKILPSAYREVAAEAEEKGLLSVVTPVMLRSLMKAKYSAAAAPHFGLGCELYCHFTSPIRRYADLATHRIIKAVLHGEIDSESLGAYEDFARDAAAAASDTELRAINAEREIEELYKTIFMSDKIGMSFDGVISSVASFGFFVELENSCEGLVLISSLDGWFEYDESAHKLVGDNGISYSLGQRVRISVSDCDIITRRVEFSLTDKG